MDALRNTVDTFASDIFKVAKQGTFGASFLTFGREKTRKLGTAFLISNYGKVLCTSHQFADVGKSDLKKLKIRLDSENGYSFARYKRNLNSIDIVLLEVEGGASGLPAGTQELSLSDETLFEIGSPILILSYPAFQAEFKTEKDTSHLLDVKWSPVGREASIAGRHRSGLLLLDFALCDGMSGSPVINAKTGKVIGVLNGGVEDEVTTVDRTKKYHTRLDFSTVIPISSFERQLEDLYTDVSMGQMILPLSGKNVIEMSAQKEGLLRN